AAQLLLAGPCPSARNVQPDLAATVDSHEVGSNISDKVQITVFPSQVVSQSKVGGEVAHPADCADAGKVLPPPIEQEFPSLIGLKPPRGSASRSADRAPIAGLLPYFSRDLCPAVLSERVPQVQPMLAFRQELNLEPEWPLPLRFMRPFTP